MRRERRCGLMNFRIGNRCRGATRSSLALGSPRCGLRVRAARQLQFRGMRKRGTMRLSGWQWLAVSRIALRAMAVAETRPQFGATLRTATSIALVSLDPNDKTQPDTVAKRNLTRLMFETMVPTED